MGAQCIFCRIIAGELPVELILDTPHVVAFRDVNPQAPVHLLVIPRRHVPDLQELAADSPIWPELVSAVQELGRREDLLGGYRVVVNTGADGGQTVPHLHLHVLGGRAIGWPPG